MKFRAKARKKAKKRRVCIANLKRQQNKIAPKDTQNIETIALSTSNEIQCTAITPNITSDKTFKSLKNLSEEKITRTSKIYQQKLVIDTEKRTSRFRKTFKKDEDCLKGNAIMNLKLLNDAISTAAMCNSCKNPQSQLTLRELRSSCKGLAQRFCLLRSSCSAATYFYSSSKDRKNAFDINIKSVHASCQGTGLVGITKIARILDIPPPVTVKAYNNIVKTLSSKSMTAREKVLNEAANNLKRFTEINNPENIVNINNKQVAKVAVTVDGTWQKRRHNSEIGVVFILSVGTGEVLDITSI